jgi:sodium/potassium-transporting ATPase subunit alpha
MFNILLIVAGILEYVLLGIAFKVSMELIRSCVKSNIVSIAKANFQNTYLGGILIAVAFLNAFIEFYQLQKSEAILASFLAMIPPSCRVVRDGILSTIAAADLVKGDVVLLVGHFSSYGKVGFSHGRSTSMLETRHLPILCYSEPRI